MGYCAPSIWCQNETSRTPTLGRTLAALELLLPGGTGLALAATRESGAPLAIWERTPFLAPTALAARVAYVRPHDVERGC